jgi:hypothetical protein
MFCKDENSISLLCEGKLKHALFKLDIFLLLSDHCFEPYIANLIYFFSRP